MPVTDEMLQKPDPANWLMWRRTLDSQGFSPLNQINTNNVAKLKHDLDARRCPAPADSRRGRRSSTTA